MTTNDERISIQKNRFEETKKLAEQGDARNQSLLGNYYQYGLGIEKDDVQAVKWYKKSAEQDWHMGQYNLAECYRHGYGIKQNYEQAFNYYKKATESCSIHDAKLALGDCYHYGYGVKQDYNQAAYWYEKVAHSEGRLISQWLDVQIKMKNFDLAKQFIENIDISSFDTEDDYKNTCLTAIGLAEQLDEKNLQLEEKNKQLELEIQQKEAVEKRMQKLVEQFTHSLGNVIFPDTIYQVAERLKNLPECRRDTLLLHEAYHAEIIIKLQAELLRQRYSNTNPEKFRLMIRNCRRNANAGEKTKTIEAILNYAVSRVTARFLNQHYAGLETIRNKILTQTHTDLNQLKQKFEDDILLHNSLSPLEWVSQNLRPIQITEISPLWKKVFILSDSYAEALLFGYFSEILFNAFKYADHESQEFLTLSFAEQTINDDIYLSCNWSNPTTNQKLSGLGTHQGLEAITEDLKQLNDSEKPEQSLLICQQDNQFQVTLLFKKDLLIDDLPILTRKRKNREINHA